MPPKGRGHGTTLAQRLQDIEERIESLDAAVRDVHPGYAERVLARMAELEQLCRGHANQVFAIMHCRQEIFRAELARAQEEGEEAIARMNEAAQRHQHDAAALRRELGVLKESIDNQHAQSTADLQKMEALAHQAIEDIEQQKLLMETVEDWRQRMTMVEATVKHAEDVAKTIRQAEGFEKGQSRVVAQSRVRGVSMPATIREAQEVATSRSPGAGRRVYSRGRASAVQR